MSIPFYPAVDLTQELNQGEPDVIVREKETWTNENEDTFSLSNTLKANDIIPKEDNNGFTKEGEEVAPVLPGSVGEGSPYAPTNWPSPGDMWTWRVGRRSNAAGYYLDRFVNLPKSLHKRNSPKQFASKPALERYILTEFPDTDINAFFASFTWKIPAPFQAATKEEAVAPFPADTLPEGGGGTEKVMSDGKEVRRTQRKRTEKPKEEPLPKETTPRATTQRKRKEKPSGASTTTQSNKQSRRSSRASAKGGAIDFSLNDDAEPGETLTTKDNRKRKSGIEDDQLSIPHIYISPVNGVLAACEPLVDINPEEFDSYLNSLEDLISQPPSDGQIVIPSKFSSPVREDELAEARMKLSSLLDMDFPHLVLFQDLNELTSLAVKVRKDPRLSAEQLVKLKLIEEMPSFSEIYLENKGVIEQADQFFSALEFNKSKVASLKNEYSELKDKLGQFQKDMDSNTVTIQQIDEQIRLLQSRRAELTNSNKNKKKEKSDLSYAQNMVANSIPKVVEEIQIANSKKAEWELKKDNALKREGEILNKFIPLKGFYL